MDQREATVCALCFVFGAVLPWALLIGGGVIGMLGAGEAAGMIAAAMSVLGLIIMLLVAGTSSLLKVKH